MALLREQVKSKLRQSIVGGRFNVGDLLPPPQELAPKWQCSPDTMRKALVELAEEGIVRRVQRKGTMVTRKPRLGTVAMAQSHDSHINGLLVGPICHGLHQLGYDVDVVPYSGDPAVTESLMQRTLATSADHVILLDPFGSELSWPVWQNFSHRVVYSLSHKRFDQNTSWITMDHSLSARQVAEHVLNLGHRNVAVVNPNDGEWGTIAARAFQDLMHIASATCHTFVQQDATSETSLRHLIEDHGVTAMWTLNDHYATSTYSMLHRMGIRVPEDVSIIGRFDTPWSLECPSPLTSVSMSPERVATTIVDVVDQHARNPDKPCELYLVSPALVARASTARVNAKP